MVLLVDDKTLVVPITRAEEMVSPVMELPPLLGVAAPAERLTPLYEGDTSPGRTRLEKEAVRVPDPPALCATDSLAVFAVALLADEELTKLPPAVDNGFGLDLEVALVLRTEVVDRVLIWSYDDELAGPAFPGELSAPLDTEAPIEVPAPELGSATEEAPLELALPQVVTEAETLSKLLAPLAAELAPVNSEGVRAEPLPISVLRDEALGKAPLVVVTELTTEMDVAADIEPALSPLRTEAEALAVPVVIPTFEDPSWLPPVMDEDI